MLHSLKEGPLKPKEFTELFSISGLPALKERPIVFYTGTGIGNILKDVTPHDVRTVHGRAKLLVGRLEGVKRPVIVVPRHADPHSNIVGHHMLPHSVNELAYNVAVAALNPVGVVTIHTIGADNYSPGVVAHFLRWAGIGGIDKTIKPGALSIIQDYVPLQVPLKTIFSREVQRRLVDKGFDLPKVGHTPLPATTIRNPELASIVEKAASETGFPIASEVVCHTIPGPFYENPALVELLARFGVTGYSMTHQQDVSSLFEALRTAGSDAKVVSVGFISNYASRKGKEVDHDAVGREADKMAPKRVPFLQKVAESLDVK